MPMDYEIIKGLKSYKRWTVSAIECYKSGCNCQECTIIAGLQSVNRHTCKMRYAVRELVRRLGAPDIKFDYGDYINDERDSENY